MIQPQDYVSSPGNFFLDLTQVAVATKTPDGQLLIYLKNSGNPIVLNCENTQTEAIIASVIGWNHHNVAKNL